MMCWGGGVYTVYRTEDYVSNQNDSKFTSVSRSKTVNINIKNIK